MLTMVESLLQGWRMRQALRGLSWMREVEGLPIEMTKVRALAGLIPIGDANGAMLIWIFDRKPGASQALAVRLTEEEADLVFAGDPYSVGLIEPVRRRLKHPWTVMIVKCGNTMHARPYRIPRRRSEDEFIAALDQAAADCPAFKLESRREMVPEVQLFAQHLDRDLVFAR